MAGAGKVWRGRVGAGTRENAGRSCRKTSTRTKAGKNRRQQQFCRGCGLRASAQRESGANLAELQQRGEVRINDVSTGADAGQQFEQWTPPSAPNALREPVAFTQHLWRGLADSTERAIREAYSNAVRPANAFEPTLSAESDGELRMRAERMRQNGGASEQETGEAFALVREAVKRELGLRLYDVQLVGGYVLHTGSIAEMRTGEGKTLVALLPSFLAYLKSSAVHIVTVNDYLAERDCRWVGGSLARLGVSVGAVQSSMPPSSATRREAYECDVTYVTNQELGFDYLRDNMAASADQLVQTRRFGLAIVDEVDSVLIDESKNPLLISTIKEEDATRFYEADSVAKCLMEGRDYTVDRKQKTAELTEEGMERTEELLSVDDIWSEDDPWARYIINAVKAREHYIRDKHYLVRNNEVHIVDDFTGRVMPRRRWSDNIHQAVEAKEGVEVQGEQAIAATITYQCFFQLYPELAGMTGTARTEAEEFRRTYGLDVISIPTHKPSQRHDSQTAVFRTKQAKWNAVAELVLTCHQEGRPVLVGTTSVEQSEHLSVLLSHMDPTASDPAVEASNGISAVADGASRGTSGIPHALLNARPHLAAKEATVVAQAGRKGAVTIATNMAGRGTDILLGGNPEMLAQHALEQYIVPALTGTQQKQLQDAAVLHVPLRSATRAAMSTAAELVAKHAPEGGASEDDAVQAARRILNRAQRGKGSNEDLQQSKQMPPAEKAATAAAEAALRDCEKQCEQEATWVRQAGGLQIIGTELHDSRRIDNQLRGRAGRQGDPGGTVFVISLEDDILSLHCPDWLAKPMWRIAGLEEDLPLQGKLLDFEMSMIQRRVESSYASSRKQVASYDEVLDRQRRSFYGARRAILAEDSREDFTQRALRYIQTAVDSAAAMHHISPHVDPQKWDIEGFVEACRQLCAGREDRRRLDAGLERLDPTPLLPGVNGDDVREAVVNAKPMPEPSLPPRKDSHPVVYTAYLAQIPVEGVDADPEAHVRREQLEKRARTRAVQLRARNGRWAAQEAALRAYIVEGIHDAYEDSCERLLQRGASKDHLAQAERMWALRAFDEHWQHHLDTMQLLRNSVNIRSFGMMDPLEEYAIDGSRAFAEICESLKRRVVEYLFYFVDIDGVALDEQEGRAEATSAGTVSPSGDEAGHASSNRDATEDAQTIGEASSVTWWDSADGSAQPDDEAPDHNQQQRMAAHDGKG